MTASHSLCPVQFSMYHYALSLQPPDKVETLNPLAFLREVNGQDGLQSTAPKRFQEE